MTLKKFYIALLLAAFTTLTACGGGGSSSSDDSTPDETTPEETTPEEIKTIGDKDVYVPEEMETKVLSGDFDGIAVLAGDSALSTSSLSTRFVSTDPQKLLKANLRETKLATTSRDVAGWIASTKAFNGETDVNDLKNSFESTLSGHEDVSSFSNTGFYSVDASLFPSSDAPSSAAYAVYRLQTYAATGVTDVAEELANEIGVNTEDGTVQDFPAAAADESQVTDFLVYIGALYYTADDVIIMVVVVPYDIAGSYQGLTKASTQPTNVASTGATTSSQTDTFTQNTTTTQADFLFVIDNSGSMGDEQDEISQIATDFENAVTSAGLDYRIGVITTGYDYTTSSEGDDLRDTNSDGGFTSSITEFQSDIKPGTSGSGTESGIYFGEKALETGGTVELDGYPRSGSTLSVIMVSDEEDQYSSYASTTFDVSNNLFVTNNYKVYVIGNDYSTYSYYNNNYVDLANATGGSSADITDKASFSLIMTNIAQAAGGAASSFQLTETALGGSVEVMVDGSEVAESTSNGFQLVNNAIVFYGSAIPTSGASVEVTYDYFE